MPKPKVKVTLGKIRILEPEPIPDTRPIIKLGKITMLDEDPPRPIVTLGKIRILEPEPPRFTIGKATFLGNPSEQVPPTPSPSTPPISSPATNQTITQNVREQLFSRIIPRNETGFAVPGPGALPGYALRPEVRAMFEDQGGIVAFDINNLSEEEKKGMAFILDPQWIAERAPGDF